MTAEELAVTKGRGGLESGFLDASSIDGHGAVCESESGSELDWRVPVCAAQLKAVQVIKKL